MPERIAERGDMSHAEEIKFFNNLIADIKLQRMGREDLMDGPIDDERLAEGDKHIAALMLCRRRTIYT